MPLGGLLGGVLIGGLGLSPALLVIGVAYFAATMAPAVLPSLPRDGPPPRPASPSRTPRRSPRPTADPEGAGHREQPVVGLGLADADPDAVAGERADHDAGRVGGRGELRGPVPEGEPDEVALGVGDVPPGLAQTGEHPVALGDQRVDPLEQRVLGGQRGDRRGLRDVA